MRMGAKKKPFYRVVVKEKRSKRDGKYLENVGTYNPMTDPAEVNLNHERVQYWISVGAQPTETVASLIKNNPFQTEEEKADAAQTRAAQAEAQKAAGDEAKKAAAAAKAEADAKKAEEEKAAEEAKKAEEAKSEAESAEADTVATTEVEEAVTEETATDDSNTEASA